MLVYQSVSMIDDQLYPHDTLLRRMNHQLGCNKMPTILAGRISLGIYITIIINHQYYYYHNHSSYNHSRTIWRWFSLTVHGKVGPPGPTSFPVRCGAGPRDLPQHRVRGRGGGLADQLRKAVGKELVGQKGLGKKLWLWLWCFYIIIIWLWYTMIND